MTNKNVKQITFILFCLKFAGLFTSILVLSLSAKYFGLSAERDSWLIITSFILALSSAVFGPLNETFRAKFTSIRMIDGEVDAIIKLRELIGFVILLSLLLSVVVLIFPHFFSKLISPHASENFYFFKMLILLLPTLLINQLISLGTSILNTYDIFYIPEILGFFSGIINLACIYIFAPSLGIYSLIVSQYIYVLLYLGVISYFLLRLKLNIYPRFKIKWLNIKPFILFSLPFFFPYFVGQINLIVEKNLSDILGQGIVSSIDYARRLTLAMQVVITSVLASVMVPDLTKIFMSQDHVKGKYDEALKKYFEILILILTLSLPLIIGASNSISTFLFYRGDMNITEISHISKLMQLFGFSFFSIALYLFFGLALLSQHRGKIYAFLGITAQLLVTIINLVFYQNVREYIFPLSISIAHIISAIGMFFLLQEVKKKSIIILLSKCIIIILFLTIIIYLEAAFFEKYGNITSLIINTITILFAVILIIFPLIGIDIKDILKKWTERI